MTKATRENCQQLIMPALNNTFFAFIDITYGLFKMPVSVILFSCKYKSEMLFQVNI